MPISFGTGGWRAVIGDGFTRNNLRRVACALARRMKREGVAGEGMVIGYDRRFLSRESAIWFSEVMAGEGVPLRFINLSGPTPPPVLISAKLQRGDMNNCRERKNRMVSVFPGCFGISVAPQNPCKSEHNRRFTQRFVPAWAIAPLISPFLRVRGADGLLRRPSQR